MTRAETRAGRSSASSRATAEPTTPRDERHALHPGNVEQRVQIALVRERAARQAGAAVAAGVIAKHPVTCTELGQLRVPLTGVGDAGVDERDGRPFAGQVVVDSARR